MQRVISPTAVRLRLPRAMRVHPTFYVSKVKPVHESPLATAQPPLPCLINGGSALAIRCLIRSHWWGRGLRHLVDSEGYGLDAGLWFSARHILDPQMVWEFHQQNADQLSQGARRPGRPSSQPSQQPPECEFARFCVSCLWN